MSLVVLIFTWNAHTPPASVEGTWKVSVAAARDAADTGRKRARNAMSATMQLTVNGTDVVGTWTTDLDGPWSITGTWKAGRLDLVSETRDISGNNGGQKVTVAGHWVIRGAFKGDTPGGTCSMIFGNGADDPLWSGWTATRSR